MLYTFANHLPFDVVELRNGEDLCGRMHVIHDRPNAQSIIPEIWIAPTVRRLGYGRYLESVGCNLATDVGASRIQLLLNEADARWPVARGFVRRNTGTNEPADMRRPNIVGTATKGMR